MTRARRARVAVPADATVSVAKLLSVVEAAAARGAPVEPLRQEFGLQPGSGQLARHISMSAYLEVWSWAMRAVRDPAFPLQVAETPIESLNLVGFLVMTSGTIEEALRRGMRFERLWMSDGRWEVLDRSRDALVLGWSASLGTPRALGERACAESALASMVLGMAALSERPVRALRVTFAHAQPSAVEAHARLFGTAPSFDAPADTLTLPAEVLTWAIPRGQPAVAQYFESQCAALLEQLEAPSDVVGRLRRLMMDQVAAGQLSRASAARQLHMSERSLLRRLEAQGTTFRALHDDVRCLIAHGLIAQGQLTMSQIASMTGFSSPSAFGRAYRRWSQDRAATEARSLPRPVGLPRSDDTHRPGGGGG